MTDSNRVIVESRADMNVGRWRLVYTGDTQRDVRGVPVTKIMNDNPPPPVGQRGRYPLQEEYKANRLGKSFGDVSALFAGEGDVLWATAKWFQTHYDIANGEPEACSYGSGRKVDAGELGGFVDAEEHEEAMGSTDPLGYQIEINFLQAIGGIDPFFIDMQGRGESIHPA
jgi:hypothetical protein